MKKFYEIFLYVEAFAKSKKEKQTSWNTIQRNKSVEKEKEK